MQASGGIAVLQQGAHEARPESGGGNGLKSIDGTRWESLQFSDMTGMICSPEWRFLDICDLPGGSMTSITPGPVFGAGQ